MYWDYGMMKNGETYGIYELYFRNDGSLAFWSDEPVQLADSSPGDIRWLLYKVTGEHILRTVYDYISGEIIED